MDSRTPQTCIIHLTQEWQVSLTQNSTRLQNSRLGIPPDSRILGSTNPERILDPDSRSHGLAFHRTPEFQSPLTRNSTGFLLESSLDLAFRWNCSSVFIRVTSFEVHDSSDNYVMKLSSLYVTLEISKGASETVCQKFCETRCKPQQQENNSPKRRSGCQSRTCL